jgi:hypothetical protein
VRTNTPADYGFDITTSAGTTVIPDLKKAYTVYNVDLSAASSNFTLNVGDLSFTLTQAASGGTLSGDISLQNNVSLTVDVNSAAINPVSGTVSGAALDSLVMTQGSTSPLQPNIPTDSSTVWRVLLRQTSQAAGNLAEILIFPSAGGERTTIRVDEIY